MNVAALKRYKTLLVVIAILLGVNYLFLYVTPQEIVGHLGVENSYLVAFLVALVGGISTITGVPLYLTIATLAAGGANPLLVGLAGGLGIFLSNSAFYLLVQYGRRSVPSEWQQNLLEIKYWVQERLPLPAVFLLIYLYLGFSPLPDDVLMVALVIAGFTYKKVAPVMLLGGLTLGVLVAYLGEAFVSQWLEVL